MEKDQVIKLRDDLKCGKNLPLRIYIDNSFTIIDESNTFHFTKWDDENAVLYSFRLIDINGSDHNPSDKQNSISFFAVPYEMIQAMMIPVLPLTELDSLFDSLSSGGCPFSDDFKKLIKHTYERALHPATYTMDSSMITSMLGDGAVNDKDDYYAHPGKFTEPFRETLRYKNRNDEIKNKNS